MERTFVAPADGRIPSGVKASKAAPTPEEVAAVQQERATKRAQRQMNDAQLAPDAMAFPGAGAQADESEPRPVDLDAIEVGLPDGRLVVYGPPPNVSLQMKVFSLLGSESANRGLSEIARVLLSIRAIDGHAVAPIENRMGLTKFANYIGDKNIDLLYALDARHWPPMTEADLPAIKQLFRHA